MTPADYLTAFVILGALLVVNHAVYLFASYRREKRRTAWRKVRIDPKGRGPNADQWYWVPPVHNGRELHLTDEELVARKVRATRNLERSHTYE